MFKDQECHKTLSNHSLILEKQVYFSFLGGVSTVGTPPLLLCNIKKIYRGSHLPPPKSSVYFKFSREKKGERYVKHFDAYQHLVVMLYAVIKRFDSLREITDFMFPKARKLAYLGINLKNQKKIGRRCLKRQRKGLLNHLYLTKGTYFFKKSSAMPVYGHCG